MPTLSNPVWISFVLLLAVLLGFFWLDTVLAQMSEYTKKKWQTLDFIFRALSWTPFPVALLFGMPALIFWRYGALRPLFELTAACVLALGIAFAGKYIFGRTRPFGHLTYIGKIDSAFPSAHAAGSFAAAFVLTNFYPGYALFFLGFAGLVALSRMYLQLHFFSDVMGGILLAYGSMLFVTRTDFLDFLVNLIAKLTL